jgi:hypothetical protein
MLLQLAPISVLEFAQIALDAGGSSSCQSLNVTASVCIEFLAVFSLCFPGLEP